MIELWTVLVGGAFLLGLIALLSPADNPPQDGGSERRPVRTSTRRETSTTTRIPEGVQPHVC